jgi:hypothetical protein
MYKGRIAISPSCCSCSEDTYGGPGGGGGADYSTCPPGTSPGIQTGVAGVGCATVDWFCNAADGLGDLATLYPGGVAECIADNAADLIAAYRDATLSGPYGSSPCDKCLLIPPDAGQSGSCCIDDDDVATGYDGNTGARPLGSCGPSWKTELVCCNYYTAQNTPPGTGCTCVTINMCDLDCYANGTCWTTPNSNGDNSIGCDIGPGCDELDAIPGYGNGSDCAGWTFVTWDTTGADPCPCDDPNETIQIPPRCTFCESPNCENGGCGGGFPPDPPSFNTATHPSPNGKTTDQRWACWTNTTCGCGAP